MRTIQSKRRRKFAEGTSVAVEKTKAELDALLVKFGATQRALFQDDDSGRAAIQFRMCDRMIRLELKCQKPLIDNPKERAKSEQNAREVWRRLLLVTKAKLEIVADGASTVEREFLADIMLPDGSRVHDKLAPQIADSYQSGQMPPLLPPRST